MSQISNIQSTVNTTVSMYSTSTQAKTPEKEADVNQQTNSATSSINITSAPPSGAAETSTTQGTAIAPAYKVEISEEGARLNRATVNASDDSDSNSDSESATTNLSIYSDSQLQQMLSTGEITQSEYNAEIAKRRAKQPESSAEAAIAGA